MTEQNEAIGALSLDRLLTVTGAQLDSYARFVKLQAPVLAPDFNMVSCLYPDENRLSAVIRMLLDPNGGHGQGEIFLSLFLDVIEKEAATEGHHADILRLLRQGMATGRTKSTLEAITDTIESTLRRIDILLDVGGVGLAIENKPWAVDQENQIEDYAEHLANFYKEHYLFIYLSGTGGIPADGSLTAEKREKFEKDGQFLVFSYLSLRNWVRHCAEKCRSTRVRIFLEDFESYITLQFDGGLTAMEKQLVIEQTTRKEHVGAAFSIASAWPDTATRLIENLGELVRQQIATKYDAWEVKVDFNYWDTNTGLSFFRKDGWSKYRIKFAFENTLARGFFCGIAYSESHENEPNDFDKQLAQTLDPNHARKGYPNDWWVWWKYFEDPYRDWSSNVEPWTGIFENGKTVVEVVSMIEEVISKVGKKIESH